MMKFKLHAVALRIGVYVFVRMDVGCKEHVFTQVHYGEILKSSCLYVIAGATPKSIYYIFHYGQIVEEFMCAYQCTTPNIHRFRLYFKNGMELMISNWAHNTYNVYVYLILYVIHYHLTITDSDLANISNIPTTGRVQTHCKNEYLYVYIYTVNGW
jgi:hypothetical protein